MEKFFNNPKETFIAFDLNYCQQVKMMMREQSYDFDQYQGFTKMNESQYGKLNTSKQWDKRLDKNLEGISKIIIFVFQNTMNKAYIQRLIRYSEHKNIKIIKISLDQHTERGNDNNPCYLRTKNIAFN